jgi:Family of unknown function (DUF6879)
VPIPEFENLLRSTQRTALHLEMRDTYAGASPGFAPWLAGQPYDHAGLDAKWHALIRPLVARGVDVRRARIVSEPVSDYIRYEHEVTPAANLAAGEQVRWLPRQRASDLALPGNDFWLFDDRVVFNYFSGEGTWVGGEVVTEAAVVKFCVSSFEAVWERAVDHSDYQPD